MSISGVDIVEIQEGGCAASAEDRRLPISTVGLWVLPTRPETILTVHNQFDLMLKLRTRPQSDRPAEL